MTKQPKVRLLVALVMVMSWAWTDAQADELAEAEAQCRVARARYGILHAPECAVVDSLRLERGLPRFTAALQAAGIPSEEYRRPLQDYTQALERVFIFFCHFAAIERADLPSECTAPLGQPMPPYEVLEEFDRAQARWMRFLCQVQETTSITIRGLAPSTSDGCQ